jgi:uncharacterized coiled-coil protein SlyX
MINLEVTIEETNMILAAVDQSIQRGQALVQKLARQAQPQAEALQKAKEVPPTE